MSKRYPILITFVNQINPHSYQAYPRKLGLDIMQDEFNGNRHWELRCETSIVSSVILITNISRRDKVLNVNRLC